MDRTAVLEQLLKVLREMQERIGSQPVALDMNSCPLRDLPQFDSLLALEASVEMEAILGCKTEDNIFFDDNNKRALTVTEIVERLFQRLTSGNTGSSL
ncbi:MAG: hypothetical protein ABL961_16185 [Vicinamibacterales bacterium]